MGKPKIRLNPQIDSIRNRVLIEEGIEIILSIALLLPCLPKKAGKGRKPYDYRIVLVLCILRILLRKRYADYESEIRTNKTIMELLKMDKLPCKSTIHNYTKQFTLSLLYRFNRKLIEPWLKKPADFIVDSSGIRIIGRSIWFCIRTQKEILKKDCEKIHLAVCLRTLLIANLRISNSKRNDSPFLRKLLTPFYVLGLVIADKGYSNKTNALFVDNKKGAFFCPFKSNATPSGFNAWHSLYNLWCNFHSSCQNIYNLRNRVEAVFSALKKRYGDQLFANNWCMRRREMAMRFIAYNVRIIIAIKIAREKNIPLWVRA